VIILLYNLPDEDDAAALRWASFHCIRFEPLLKQKGVLELAGVAVTRDVEDIKALMRRTWPTQATQQRNDARAIIPADATSIAMFS
jgi:hypothetical protein